MELPLPDVLLLTRICACVAVRNERRLKKELQNAIRSGISISIIREAILQSYLFAGYAAAINAFIVLNELVPQNADFLRESQADLKEWNLRGEKLCRKIYGSQYEKLFRNMKSLHPDLADWMIWEGYGKVLSRLFLSPRVRELLIVGMTAVLKVERQFHSHVKGALHVGASPEELIDVLDAIRASVRYKSFVKTLTTKSQRG